MNTKPQAQGQKEERAALAVSVRGQFVQMIQTMATICEQLLNSNQPKWAGSFAAANGENVDSYPMYCNKPVVDHRFSSSTSNIRGSEWPHSIRGGNSLSRRGPPSD